MSNVHVVDHPLVQHKLTLMRKKETSTAKFRNLMREIGQLLAYEITRDLPIKQVPIDTPLGPMQAPMIDGKKPALISILRAGNGMVDGFIQLIPVAKIGHIGLYRDSSATSVVEYYIKFPKDISQRDAIVLDPMLATGQTAVAAVNRLKQVKPRSIVYVSVLAAPEGVEYFRDHHPDVAIYTCSIDEKLNEKKYIIPGLGDAGDRLFGTI